MEQENFSATLKGYAPCRNQDEIVQNTGYDPEADLENPTGSVFLCTWSWICCAMGSGGRLYASAKWCGYG